MTEGRQIDLSAAAIVSDRKTFAETCDHLAGVDRFAFDAEFVGEDNYNPQVCLVQVASQQHIWLIDPLGGLEIGRFWELVADQRIETVVHAGLEDLALSYEHTGQPPGNVFDIQIAAGLVGVDYPLSLQRLARFAVGARLHKSQTLTDWRKRPLTPRQIQYAVEDVGYMLPIHAVLRRRLEAAGRTEWGREEFARFTDAGTYRHEERDLLSKVRGLGSLRPKVLAVARELAVEREELARQHNRPTRALLKDHLLVTIAKHGWTRPEDMMALRGFTLRGQALRRMTAAVQRGLETPPDRCPKPKVPDQDTPHETALCKLISAVLYDHCQTHQIAFPLVCTSKDIRAAVLAHTRSPGSVPPRALQRGWRKGEVGGLIDEILSGRRSIRVLNGKDGFQLQVT